MFSIILRRRCVWMLPLACLLMPSCGYVMLREGEKCGAWIEGACESDLICLSNGPETASLFYAEGVCARGPGCNCSEFQCPRGPRSVCRTYHVMNPCGCCSQCGKREGQVCGGPSWRYGNCDWGLVCILVVGLDPVRTPHMGVCKKVPKHLQDTFPEQICPVQYGCNVHTGVCDCYSDHSCHARFSYRTHKQCNKVVEEDRKNFNYDYDELKAVSVQKPVYVCTEWSCEPQDCKCVCQKKKCDFGNPPLDEEACCKLLKQYKCPNASCPEIPSLPCPADSFLSQPYTEPGQCCPSIPAMCTCNFNTCKPKPKYCSNAGIVKLTVKANGHPGTCCDHYECVNE